MFLKNLLYKNSYKLKAITYYCKRYICGNYEIKYELYKKDETWFAVIETYNNDNIDFTFSSSSKRDVIKQLEQWFQEIVYTGMVDTYIKDDFKIYLKFPDVLKDVRETIFGCQFGYHITSSDYRNSILKNGLIYNIAPSKAVNLASQAIDLKRPKSIKFRRENSNYLWPMMTNYTFGSENKNNDLFAVRITDIDSCHVGSQSIGGFCLADEEIEVSPNENYLHWKYHIERYKHDQDYWKYSCTLKTYLKNSFSVRQKDKYAGLDEILVPYNIKPEDIILIGSWDYEGNFHESITFKNFVYKEYQKNYKEILEKYKATI